MKRSSLERAYSAFCSAFRAAARALKSQYVEPIDLNVVLLLTALISTFADLAVS